ERPSGGRDHHRGRPAEGAARLGGQSRPGFGPAGSQRGSGASASSISCASAVSCSCASGRLRLGARGDDPVNVPLFFINRPKFAIVISIVTILAGLLAMLAIPVAQFPDITPPQIQVSASYPGASAEDVANSVAAPIEAQ